MFFDNVWPRRKTLADLGTSQTLARSRETTKEFMRGEQAAAAAADDELVIFILYTIPFLAAAGGHPQRRPGSRLAGLQNCFSHVTHDSNGYSRIHYTQTNPPVSMSHRLLPVASSYCLFPSRRCIPTLPRWLNGNMACQAGSSDYYLDFETQVD
jgi:hypothetical protein